MNIREEAKRFAINAHKGQVRKSEKDKPMIIHPINVANILSEYGFDDNVVAAGYLHDVVEDTKYTLDDIKIRFNTDIKSLVDTASEPDKNLSWEERKKHTIEAIKKYDLRHKAVVCADKISNLEDLMILSEKQGKYNFDSFKRGFDSQKWYYENIYQSLITDQNENLPMFIRLKTLINHIFNGERENDFIDDTVFEDKEEYKELLKINYKLKEIKKLRTILVDKFTYVIEFTGTPRTGKTTLINNLKDFFKKGDLNVSVLEEFITSKKYKEEIYPKLKNECKKVINYEIPKYVKRQLEDELSKELDIIIVDRSLFDRTIWIDRLFHKNEITAKEYNNYLEEYLPIIKDNINIIIATYADSITALRRDYMAYLSLAKRNFLNEDNINEYNISLNNMKNSAESNNINIYLFDTTNKLQRTLSIDVINNILDDMRKFYIKKANKEYGYEISNR